jgi:hypothetical protein
MKDTFVITTFSKANYEEYAKTTIDSWKKNWPSNWKLVTVDAEVDVNEDIKLECPEKHQWISYVKSTGINAPEPKGHERQWEKFCHKSYAQIIASQSLSSGYMIWLDADVKFLKTPPSNLVEKEITGFFSGYLGRDGYKHKSNDGRHSAPETGIIFYDLDHAYSKNHFAKLKEIYSGHNLFNYPAWSDEVIYGILKDITPSVYKSVTPTYSRFPLAISHLSEYFEHWMGGGKLHGKDVQGLKQKNKMSHLANL